MNRHTFCIETARAAGEKVLELAHAELSIATKDGNPKDIVTNVDTAVNAHITSEIAKVFPGEAIYSEEAPTKLESGVQWVIDPVDGTANFSRAIPHYAVCIGVLENGAPLAGAIFNPVTNELYSFEKGGGVFLNGAKIQVSNRIELNDASVLLRAGRKPEFAEWGGRAYTGLLKNAWKTGGFGSASLDTCFVAAGRVEASVYGQFSALDSAPALGVLIEAGGVAIGRDGSPISYTIEPQTVIAANSLEMAEKIRALVN